MKKEIFLLIMYIVMVIVNAMAIIIPLGGYTTQELSGMYPNLFVPANLTFSIWSLIYLMLLIGVIQQIIYSNKGQEKVLPSKVVNLMIINFALNALWILAWQYQIMVLSVIIMLLILLSLIYITTILNSTNKQYGIIRYAISIYLGWISVATIANISAALVKYDWSAFGIDPTYWTVIVLIVAGILGFLASNLKKDYLYTLVVIWAFIGIIIKQYNQNNTIVITTAVLSCLLILTLLVNQARSTRIKRD